MKILTGVFQISTETQASVEKYYKWPQVSLEDDTSSWSLSVF